jgi:hypothetical protein
MKIYWAAFAAVGMRGKRSWEKTSIGSDERIFAGMPRLFSRTSAADMLARIGFRGRQFALAQIRNSYDYQQYGHTEGGKDIQQRRLFEINQQKNQQGQCRNPQ